MKNKNKISKYDTNDEKLNSELKTNTKHRNKRRSRIGRRTKEMVEIGKERIRLLLTKAEEEAVLNKTVS